MALLQTILWVGLIGGILWRFHLPIEGILSALDHRIEGGAGLRAGPFEISQQVRPQPPEQQAAQLQAEVQQLEQSELGDGEGEAPANAPIASTAELRTKYQQAEDLALREIQSEYGAPINRQITLGSDRGFDGFFVQDGSAHVVDVKLVRKRLQESVLRQSKARLLSIFQWYGWRNVELILVVVFDSDSVDLESEQTRLNRLAAESSERIIVKCYSLRALAKKYGAELSS